MTAARNPPPALAIGDGIVDLRRDAPDPAGKAAALMTPIDAPLIDADDVASLMDRFARKLDPA